MNRNNKFTKEQSEYVELKFLTNDDYVFVDDFGVTHGLQSRDLFLVECLVPPTVALCSVTTFPRCVKQKNAH